MAKDLTQQNIDSWLTGKFDQNTKKEILRMQEEDPAALSDAFYRTLEFGTGGMRGILGVGTNRMNKYTVGFATQGLANYLIRCFKENIKVAISFDSRNCSTEFASIAANILAANEILRLAASHAGTFLRSAPPAVQCRHHDHRVA